MQLLPDYWMTCTPETFTEEFKMEWRGPGLYRTDSDICVVIPDGATPATIWSVRQAPDETFKVYLWNRNFRYTAVSMFHCMPTRSE